MEINADKIAFPRFEWLSNSEFIMSKSSIKEMMGPRNTLVLNMVFLHECHAVPQLCLTGISFMNFYMNDIPYEKIESNDYPHILKHSLENDPEEAVYKSEKKKGDVMQYIFRIVRHEIQIQLAFNQTRSFLYTYKLPPVLNDAYLLFLIPRARTNPLVKLLTDSEYLDYKLKKDLRLGKVQSEKDTPILNHHEKEAPKDFQNHNNECKICYNNEANRIFIPCGHCYCLPCCERIRASRNKNCPICCEKCISTETIKKVKECLVCHRRGCHLSAVAIPCGCLFACWSSVANDKIKRCPNCDQSVKMVYQAFFA